MASPSLSQNPAAQTLLDALEPNILPPEPSAWPLAIGYWFVIAFVLIAIAGCLFWFYKTKRSRQLNAEIKRIESLTDPHEQSKQAHQLLRWVCIHIAGQNKGMSDTELADKIAPQFDGKLPAWLNSHYRNAPASVIDWQQYRFIIQHLKRRGDL